jgi:hypothetical protein
VHRYRITSRLLVCAVVACAWAARPHAQERPAPVVELTGGWLSFPDDGVVREAMVGGAARWYASPRLGIGPEISYIRGRNHRHVIATVNVTWDLLSPPAGELRPVAPFVVAGGGFYQTREQFPVGPYTSGEGAFTAGGGVRARAGNRVTVGVDARIGWELHLRINGLVGVRLGP